MKIIILRLMLSGTVALAAACSTPKSPPAEATVKTKAPQVTQGKTAAVPAATDELDDYAEVAAFDPLEPLNRVMFKMNDCLYLVVFRPVSKGYQFVLPKPVRKGINNAFDNVKYPVRFVNCTLQGNFKRAGQETGKFLVNSLGGLGGIFRVSDKVPDLVNIPSEDLGQTLAKWGVGQGPFIILPLLGPSSARDTVGLAGDYVLNPVNWGFFWHGGGDWEHDWTMIPPTANTLRSLPEQLDIYDAATKEAVDPYISARSAFIQNRAEATRE
jgi:phospholipid-binding lipoprotein MlaA